MTTEEEKANQFCSIAAPIDKISECEEIVKELLSSSDEKFKLIKYRALKDMMDMDEKDLKRVLSRIVKQ